MITLPGELSRYFLNLFVNQTTPSPSLSVIPYLFCASVSGVLAYATGCSMPFSSSCARHPPRKPLLASTIPINGLEKSGNFSTGADISACFTASNAASDSSVHSTNSCAALCLPSSLFNISSALSGPTSSAYSGTNRCMNPLAPRNVLISATVCMGCSAASAFTLSGSTATPSPMCTT